MTLKAIYLEKLDDGEDTEQDAAISYTLTYEFDSTPTLRNVLDFCTFLEYAIPSFCDYESVCEFMVDLLSSNSRVGTHNDISLVIEHDVVSFYIMDTLVDDCVLSRSEAVDLFEKVRGACDRAHLLFRKLHGTKLLNSTDNLIMIYPKFQPLDTR